MNEDIQRCGNELIGLLNWLIHHGGDPHRDNILVKDLTAVFSGVNQVVLSSYAANKQLGADIRKEGVRSFMTAANQFASTNVTASV